MPITFKVSDVELPEPEEGIEDGVKDGFAGYHAFPANVLVGVKCGDVEPDGYRLNLPVAKLLYDPLSSGFMSAIHIAYDAHLPLTLSPDDLWCVIVRGLAIHINENAEKLRHLFVSHEGKKSLILEVLFSKGDPSIDWEAVLAKFRDMISRNTSPGTADLTAHNFSTTGPVEATVGHVALMGAMQNYFRYGMMTACGIPTVTLLGTPEDWESIKLRVERDFTRDAMDLGWWLDSLIPILDQFIRASKGDVDVPFWESIYKEKSMSGGSTVSGSFVNLFPYLTTQGKNYRNPWLGKDQIRMAADEYPKGYTTVPFEWDCMGTKYPMNFVAGHLGVGMVDGSIRPVLGWAVADQPSEKKKSGRR